MTRIVVTGQGLVGPLGRGVEATWSKILSSQSGLRRLPPGLAPDIAAQVAGLAPGPDEADGFDLDAVVALRDQKKIDRFIAFALATAEEALTQSDWTPVGEGQRARTATIIGTAMGGLSAAAAAVRTLEANGARRLSPFAIPAFLPNLAAGWVSIRHGLEGPVAAPATACAAGAQAIGDGARMIRSGEVDVAVCGGADAAVDRIGLGMFAAARTLTAGFNDAPERASRPFDAAHEGFVMGEGAAVLVIEALDHALARGARPIAELVGYGTSADAHHITASRSGGEGARRAMAAALAQAGVDPAQVDHLNAHATSTPLGDRAEATAIRSLFAGRGRPAISATKSATGHLLGAAGALEAIFTTLALRDQVLPPTLNLHDPIPATEGLDLVALTARRAPLRYALSNSFGFGGVNASVLFKRWEG